MKNSTGVIPFIILGSLTTESKTSKRDPSDNSEEEKIIFPPRDVFISPRPSKLTLTENGCIKKLQRIYKLQLIQQVER